MALDMPAPDKEVQDRGHLFFRPSYVLVRVAELAVWLLMVLYIEGTVTFLGFEIIAVIF